MATVSKWTPFGVALDVTATGGTVTRTSATQYKVVINVSWETYYSGAQTTYGMTAASGGVTHTISKFDGTKRSSGSGSFTGTYSISGNSAATKTVTVTFRNFNDDNDDSATKNVSFSVSVPAWTSYKITYNANGGSGAPGQQTKWKDQTLTLSSTKPTRTGYSFLGWSTSSSATSATYSAGGNYTANSAATLYAVWKANTYTVTYNANGGTGAPGNQTKTYGQTLKLSSTKPTRTNYNFKGWGTSASATTVSYAAGGNYTANAAVTLYAIWELAYTKPRISNLTIVRIKSESVYSEGLEYGVSWVDSNAYAVEGFGTCTDTDIIIPPTYDGHCVNLINYAAFANENITSVVIPDTVSCIDEEAFRDCSNLTNVVMGGGVHDIYSYAFEDCSSLKRVDFLKHTFIPEIDIEVFYNPPSDLQILVPADLYDEWIEATNWSEWADYIVAAEGVESEYSEGLEYSVSACFTDGCEVTGIGNCTDIDMVIPPYCEDGAVTEICTSAFEGCDDISTVVIPDTVTYIDDDAFWNCVNLTNVVMGGSVHFLGMNVFQDCENLKRVDFSKHTFIPEIDTDVFYNPPSDLQILVPADLYDEWIEATNWSEWADYIVKASDAGGGSGGGEVVLIESDDGKNAKVKFYWACDKTISSIVIKWKLTTESTYSNSRTVTASGTSGAVEELITGDVFDTESSYDIHVTVTDSNGSSYAVGVLPSMKFVVDFLAGGKGASVGKVAELEDVFDVGFKTRLLGGLLYPILEPGTDLNTVLTPNTYAGENSNAANYGNCPITSGTFIFEVMSAGPNGQLLQRLTVCDKTKPAVYERFYYTSAWGEWYGGWIYPTLGSDFVMYGTDTTANRTRYRKDGRIVEVRGIVKPAVSLPKSGGTNTTAYTIFTLPVGYRPTSPIYTVCQGSGNCVWMLQVNTNGNVTFARYRNGNTNATADTGAWLPFQVTFLAN